MNKPVSKEQIFRDLAALQLEVSERENRESLLFTRFPDTGPFRRELYPKHISFFEAGLEHRIRLFLAANRVGKTEAACYEDVLHLTGLYPPWWKGKVFETPTKVWLASDSAKTTREILQITMFGEKEESGTGLVPKSTIIRATAKHGLADAYDTVYIRHITGGISKLVFKSFEESVDKFKGTAQHVIHLDEEPPEEIVAECVVRTMTTGGRVTITMMPLMGRTPLVEKYLENCVNKEEVKLALAA